MLLELDHSVGIKRSYRGRKYVQQKVLTLMARAVKFRSVLFSSCEIQPLQ